MKTFREAINFDLILGIIIAAILIFFLYSQANAQHRMQDMPMHQRFYSTWMMPDNRAMSCCSNQDCRPAASKQVDGEWYAKPDGENDWMHVPSGKVEKDRDTPDGQSHVCYRRYDKSYVIYCFIAGVGG